MDAEFVATVEDQHDDLQETPGTVETKPKLSSRAVVVEVLDQDGDTETSPRQPYPGCLSNPMVRYGTKSRSTMAVDARRMPGQLSID